MLVGFLLSAPISFAQRMPVLSVGGNDAHAGVHHFRNRPRRQREGHPPITMSASTLSGGELEARHSGPDCVGFVDPTPTLIVHFSGQTLPHLRFSVESPEDTVLLIRGPRGNFFCNDDAHDLNPEIVFQNASIGRYEVWVGSYDQHERHQAVVTMTQVRRQNPQARRRNTRPQEHPNETVNPWPRESEQRNNRRNDQRNQQRRNDRNDHENERRPALDPWAGERSSTQSMTIEACDRATVYSRDLQACLNAAQNVRGAAEVVAACDRATVSSSDLTACVSASQGRRRHGAAIVEQCDRATVSARDLVECIRPARSPEAVRECDRATVSTRDLVTCVAAAQVRGGQSGEVVQACDRATVSSRDLRACVQAAPNAHAVIACDRATVSTADLTACLHATDNLRRAAGPVVTACDQATVSSRDLIACVQAAPNANAVSACERATVSSADLVRCLGG